MYSVLYTNVLSSYTVMYLVGCAAWVTRINHLLTDVLAALQVVVSVRKDLRLHDGNNTVLKHNALCYGTPNTPTDRQTHTTHTHTHLLADAGVAGQYVGILHDGQLRGCVLTDLQHRAPLGEVSTILLVLSTALRQSIQTYTQT